MATVEPMQLEVEVIKFVGDLTTVTVKPGDVVVLMSNREISSSSAEHMKNYLKAAFPDSKCLVLGGGMKLGIISMEPGTEVAELPK